MAFADDAEKEQYATWFMVVTCLAIVWRFNIETNNGVLKLATLKVGGITQPITTSPELGLVNNKKVVFVGTGKYLEMSDLRNTSHKRFMQ